MTAASLIAMQSAAVTIHRSFRPREVGIGAGASVVVPVEAKIAQAIDEGREKEQKKPQVVIGKVTKVCDGDTIHVVTSANVRFKVRLNRIDAPESDQPHGKESTAYLASLIRGKTVRVEYTGKDRYNRILGDVFLEQSNNQNNKPIRQDINLTMVATGNAWHFKYFDKTPAYAEAENAAKTQRIGLWAGDDPISPYEWRKSKRGK